MWGYVVAFGLGVLVTLVVGLLVAITPDDMDNTPHPDDW